MSINVNVTGNPISIKRGKMVTADSDYATKELQKRRRIRLEQVRQQSKEIAANVRDKIRREKNKQLSDIEKLGERELKQWQARKLLELQQQYRDCLQDIGLGHAQAIVEEEAEDALLEQQESYDQLRKERGKDALVKVRNELNEKEDERINCNERRIYNRAVENARSSLVVTMTKVRNKSPFKKKKKKKICKSVVSDNFVVDSGSEPEVPLNTVDSAEVSSPVTLDNMDKNEQTSAKISEKEVQIDLLESNAQEVENTTRENLFCPVDTRISDRIKRRRYRAPIYDLTNEPSFYRLGLDNIPEKTSQGKLVDKEAQTSYVETQLPSRELPTSHRAFDFPVTSNDKRSSGEPHTRLQIPIKPKITLRTNEGSATESHNKLGSGYKVQHYDHKNRFSKEYEAPMSSVQRVNDDSIEVCPSVDSEVGFADTMFKRDREAMVRGQRAMEKVKAQQDYKQIMNQLPKLQKKERLAALTTNKQEFHMSGDRLKENERKRQNRLENAYDKLFPQSQIITIPPKPAPKSNINNLQGDQNFNSKRFLGTWDIDKPDPVIPPHNAESNLLNQIGKKLEDDESASMKRKESLQKMLKSLTEHRDKLANELKSIPQTSNLHKVLGDLTSIDEVIESGHSLNKESVNPTEPTRTSSPKAPAKRSETHSPKNTTKECIAPKSQLPVPKSSSSSRPQTVVDKKKTPAVPAPAKQPAKPKVYRYKCKNIPENTEKPPRSRKASPTSRKSSISPREPSPLDKCHCRRAKNEPAAEKCECKDFYSSKSYNKIDVGVVAATSTEDKGVSTTSIVEKADNLIQTCVCGTVPKPPAEACEIVIKICDEGKHKISVSPTRSVEKVESESKWNKPKSITKVSSNPKTTWKECFSRNSSNSTSTSYYSPPEVLAPVKKATNKRTSTTRTLLRCKPQQLNLNDSSVVSASRKCVKLDDRMLLRQIKQLLSMSRGSVDELAVSTVSDVSTPASSIVNIESNCENQFEHILKHLNIDLSRMSNSTTTPPCQENAPSNNNAFYNTGISAVESTSTTIQSCSKGDTRSKTIDQYASENYPDILNAYNEMAESCAKKIENLAAMIENVRLEKMKIFENSPMSDRENSTKYYDLPAQDPCRRYDCVSPEQMMLNEKMLEIRPDAQQKVAETPDTALEDSSLNNTNQELLNRFNKLKEINGNQSKCEPNCNREGVMVTETVTASPIWLDIPRLPAFTASTLSAETTARAKSKPPPSRGITVARCYNRDITALPHELSEIPEVESFVSGKHHNTRISNKSKSPMVLSAIGREIFKDNSDSNFDSKQSSSSISIPDILSGIDSPIQVLNTEVPTRARAKEKVVDTISILSQKTLLSDSSTNEMETIEGTLKRLGMGWAVATIKKTQEALALTSTSSSSIEANSIHTNGDSLNKHSSGTLCSSNSSNSALSMFLRGLVDTTQLPDSGSSINKTSRKTSTPVQVNSFGEEYNRISTQPNIILTAESDMSSIKHNGSGFDYMPFYSLNEVTENQDDVNQ